MRGLEETHIRSGDNVAVIGLGPIGLMFVRLAKIYGENCSIPARIVIFSAAFVS
jgi:L-iditol 2-dehydrogenase